MDRKGKSETTERKDRVIADVSAKLTKIQASGKVDPEIWYQQALLSSIEDNGQMALIHLQRAIDEGWRQHWRPGFEPIFKDLITEKNFQSMMAGLETRMDIMREQLVLAASFDSDWSG
jgi:hypothetical protein|tara:strand:- start:174 stop:527 length:354 start_codon:yes stop_codon:yes gene_type:complete